MPLTPIPPSILCSVRRPAAGTKLPAVVSPSPLRALVPNSPGPKASELKPRDLSPPRPPPRPLFSLNPQPGPGYYSGCRAPVCANFPCAGSWPRAAGGAGPTAEASVAEARDEARPNLLSGPGGDPGLRGAPGCGRTGPQRGRACPVRSPLPRISPHPSGRGSESGSIW